MNEMMCYRGNHGDVRPVEVLRRGAVNDNGCFRAGYYATEVEAWAGILAAWSEDVSVCEGEEARAYQDYLNARRETVAAYQRQVEAWAGILAAWSENVSVCVCVCEGDEARAYQDYLNARRETVAAYQRQAQAGQNYEAWRKGLTLAQGARMLEAVGN